MNDQLLYRKKLLATAAELDKMVDKQGEDVAKESFTARRKRKKLTKLLQRKVAREEKRIRTSKASR